ncbi:TonB-dependent receptor domain-containing protein, partial [Bacteroidota bacterium]
LRSVPNVSSIRKGGTNLDPVVRGFRFGQLNVQANRGMKIEGGCPNRMDPATSHIEMDDIDEIEIIKGPYALRYGPSIGGVINLITARPVSHKTFEVHVNAIKGFESNSNGQKEHIAIAGGNEWIFFLLSGNNKEYGDYEDGDGNTINTNFRKYDYKAQIGTKLFKKHMILFSWDEIKGRDVMYPALPMDERTDDTRLMSFDYEVKDLSKTIKGITFKYYNSNVAHVMDNKDRPFSDTVAAVSAIDAINSGYRFEVNLKLGEDQIYVGTDYEKINKDGIRTKNMIMQPELPVKVEQLWNEAVITNNGFFIEYRTKLATIDWVLAGRMDMNKGTSEDIIISNKVMGVMQEIYNYSKDSIDSEFTNISLSLGATKKITQNLSISLSLGRGVRSPDMVERYVTLLPVGFDKYDYVGDPQLKPEVNNQADIAIRYDNEKFGAFELGFFYAIVNDYITGKRIPPSQQKPLSNTVLGVKQFYNAEEVNFNGFEFSYGTPNDYKWGARFVAALTQATISKATKQILDNNGVVIGEEEVTDDPLNEIPPFESTVSVFYKFFDGKLVPKFSARIVSKQTRVSEAFYEAESDGFTILNLETTFKFNNVLTVAGGINNLLDQAFYEHLNRNIIGSKTNLYEPGRIFFVNMIFSL